MKRGITLTIVTAMLIFSACNSTRNEQSNSEQTFDLDTTKLSKGDTFYQCEMHPEVLSDKPGNCPKCGMELIKVEKK